MKGGVGGEVAEAPAGPPPPLEWKFSQVFGERTAGEEVQEGNYVTTMLDFDFCSIWIPTHFGVSVLIRVCLLDIDLLFGQLIVSRINLLDSDSGSD